MPKRTKTIKFYDVKSKRPVRIPVGKTRSITRKNKRTGRNVRMLTATGPRGNKLYKIVKG